MMSSTVRRKYHGGKQAQLTRADRVEPLWAYLRRDVLVHYGVHTTAGNKPNLPE